MKEDIKQKIIIKLKEQGFEVTENQLRLPDFLNKSIIRKLNSLAVNHKIQKASKALKSKESNLLSYIANGEDINVAKIQPKLKRIEKNSIEELLFRYISLHWSIPVSSGYGRRLRFIVYDESNNKVIGIIGLGDPVYSLKKRDEWIGWSQQDKKERLRYVMDAFVLGAVPPYNYLLGGKLVAMLVASKEVKVAFKEKYMNSYSYILNQKQSGELALITTTSALGKSSIYNRIKYNDRLLYHKVGFTSGYGEFQFLNGVYDLMKEFIKNRSIPTAKQEKWGKGYRNRREVVRKSIKELGLGYNFSRHGIKREIYVIPLGENTQDFLRGNSGKLIYYNDSTEDIFSFFKTRWLKNRMVNDKRYYIYDRERYRIWR